MQGLAKARAKGIIGGNPNIADARKIAIQKVSSNADKFADEIAPIIAEIKQAGASTFVDIAAELNRRNIPTARGGKWYGTSVSNIIRRIEKNQAT